MGEWKAPQFHWLNLEIDDAPTRAVVAQGQAPSNQFEVCRIQSCLVRYTNGSPRVSGLNGGAAHPFPPLQSEEKRDRRSC